MAEIRGLANESGIRSVLSASTAWWDRLVESVRISKGLMGEMMRLEIMSDDLDVVQFGHTWAATLSFFME
jgi:hypothetical protein